MRKLVNYCWRIIATGFCFFCFGIGALIISSIIFPLQSLLIKDKHQRNKTARFTIHKSFHFFVSLMKYLGLLEVHLENFKALKKTKGQIIIANHPSLIDVVLIIAYLPNADCVVKSQLFKNPFLRGVVKSVGYINNENPEQLFIDCKKSLASGCNIVIFPEGTRTENANKLNFKRGAANIAIRCQAHYQPILISLDPSTLTKKESWYNIPPKKFVVVLKAQPQINITKYFERESLSLSVRSLTKEIEQYFCKELKLND